KDYPDEMETFVNLSKRLLNTDEIHAGAKERLKVLCSEAEGMIQTPKQDNSSDRILPSIRKDECDRERQSDGASLGREGNPRSDFIGGLSSRVEKATGISLKATFVIYDYTGRIWGLDIGRFFPELSRQLSDYEKKVNAGKEAPLLEKLVEDFKDHPDLKPFLDFFKSQNHAIVITGELEPKSVLMRIAQGTTTAIHYEHEKYFNELQRVAREMIRKGTLTEDKLKQHGYFVYLPETGLSVEEFLKEFLSGKRVGPRSLSWLKQANGLKPNDPVVLLEDNDQILNHVVSQVVSRVLPLEMQDLAFNTSEGKAFYDLVHLILAEKLAYDPKSAEGPGFLINVNGLYKPSEYLIKTILENTLLKHQLKKLLAQMA
ncbi:MAG: hypothetical protein HZC17_03150, partial [Candidatus Omnitrophica bacterium]|nr:hypothetical protein [Candidatus Omnitrophota bacterium]